MTAFLRSYFEALPGIEGWFSGEAALLFMAYNQLIVRDGICGDVLEIGVHHGKSAIAMASMKASTGRFYAVDLFEDGQAENTSGSGSGDRQAFVRNMRRFFNGLDSIEIIAGSSQQLTPEQLRRNFSFCHVDGGHSARETYLDIQLCEEILLPGGLLALDDYFNEWFPGVSEGAARYMLEHPGALAPVAIGFNKVLFQKSGARTRLRERFAERFDFIPRTTTEFWDAPAELFIAGLSLFVDLDRSTPQQLVPAARFPYSLAIEPQTNEVQAERARSVEVPVHVRNRSGHPFPPGAAPAGLSYHVLTPGGAVVSWDNPRINITPSLGPDEDRPLLVSVTAPPLPGHYVVELDVVWENVTWLKDRGNQTSTLLLTVPE
jgi:hypothetical protein